MNLCKSYQEWRHAIVDLGGCKLDKNFCEERIKELQDDRDASTKAFIKAYGASYRDQIIIWFQQALSEL